MKKLVSMAVGLLSVAILGGCSLSLSTKSNTETEELQQLRAMGIISYEESTKGIPISANKIVSKLEDGHYYVLHDNVLYPCYTDMTTYSDIPKYGPDPNVRFNAYTSESVIDIPTLFEGDKLYYYSPSGVLMYSTFERFKDLGWSVGLRNIKSTPAGYCYLDIENEKTDGTGEGPCIMRPMNEVRNLSDTNIFIDKIGGVKITKDYCENGIINGLVEGINYDIEFYDGTNYKYYSSECNTRFFQSYEVYLIDKYTALQDFLYEIEIPEYLLEGYYDVDAKGMFRYVKGKEYSDDTDFNERLLYQYYAHDKGDTSWDTHLLPSPYSENPEINQFKAYDEGYFAWEQTREKTREELEEEAAAERDSAENQSPAGVANYIAASLTKTELWLPEGRPYKIVIESKESTGSISLCFSNGRAAHLPYDRISGTYTYEGVGKNEIATLETKGLYDDYKITMTNAETYNGQDIEAAKAADAAAAEQKK